eukprot:1705086-Rhodomonas_salina.1
MCIRDRCNCQQTHALSRQLTLHVRRLFARSVAPFGGGRGTRRWGAARVISCASHEATRDPVPIRLNRCAPARNSTLRSVLTNVEDSGQGPSQEERAAEQRQSACWIGKRSLRFADRQTLVEIRKCSWVAHDPEARPS